MSGLEAARASGRPKVVHASVTRALGGVYEIVSTELRQLERRGVRGDWVVTAPQEAVRHVAPLLQYALAGRGPEDLPVAEAQSALQEFRSRHEDQLVAAAADADAVILHDPVCAALTPALRTASAHVIWRCHTPCAGGPASEAAQKLLYPLLADADTVIFYRPGTVWPVFDADERVALVPPGIDGESWKNRELDQAEVESLWSALWALDPIQLPAGDGALAGQPVARIDDARTGKLKRPDAPFILHVARWDPTKGHMGVLRGFRRLAEVDTEIELVFVGPYIADRSSYPNREIFEELMTERASLAPEVASRVHIWKFSSPHSYAEDLALNVLRRKARTVVQNSLIEGFGLTVTEAMWQRAVVVGSAVGGIADQIKHDVNGLLTPDTRGGDAWAETVRRSLTDETGRSRWASAAKRTVQERYLAATAVDKQLTLLGLHPEG